MPEDMLPADHMTFRVAFRGIGGGGGDGRPLPRRAICAIVGANMKTSREEPVMINLWEHHLFDGGMGTMLQAAGLEAGACPERLNLTARRPWPPSTRPTPPPGRISSPPTPSEPAGGSWGRTPAPYIAAGVALAKKAGAPYAALDVGPLGGLMAPFGDMTFDEAYGQFTEIVRAGAAAGADLVLIETMSDLLRPRPLSWRRRSTRTCRCSSP